MLIWLKVSLIIIDKNVNTFFTFNKIIDCLIILSQESSDQNEWTIIQRGLKRCSQIYASLMLLLAEVGFDSGGGGGGGISRGDVLNRLFCDAEQEEVEKYLAGLTNGRKVLKELRHK